MVDNNIENNILDKETIFLIIQNNRDKIRKFGVKKIGLFGSFVRNAQKNTSDIDLLIRFEKGKKSFRNFIDLAYFLEDLFGRKVEIVTEESLSPYIGNRIVKEVEYAIIWDVIRNEIPKLSREVDRIIEQEE